MSLKRLVVLEASEAENASERSRSVGLRDWKHFGCRRDPCVCGRRETRLVLYRELWVVASLPRKKPVKEYSFHIVMLR